MKKLIFVVMMVISSSSFAYGWFNVQAQCQLLSGVRAACQVCNNSNARVYCRMDVWGMTRSGLRATGWQENFVLPGLCMTGYVSANNPWFDPLFTANANTACRVQ